MHGKLNKGLTLGLVGNLSFIGFGIVCYIYYMTFDFQTVHSRVLEIIAYLLEFTGFGLLAVSVLLICRTVRMRFWLKFGLSFYTVMEAVMMVLELNSYRLEWYDPYSLLLAIIHSVISAAVCFAMLSFDPYKNKFEVITIICIGIILGGMFGNILGIRIYFSIVVNAVAFADMFFSIKKLLKNQDIEIDCYGDRARVAEYKSDFFDE